MESQVALWVAVAALTAALMVWLVRRHVTFRSHIERPNDRYYLMELGISLSPKARAREAGLPSPEFVVYFSGRWP